MVTADRNRQISIPNSLAHYGKCLDELQQIGIPVLPPSRTRRWQRFAGWLLQFVAVAEVILILDGTPRPLLQNYHRWMLVAGALPVGLTAWAAITLQSPKYLTLPKR
ncbi:hypothetical protein ACPOL_2047 [Acidisarcina polymorpha]|uniref:Uncharacterized protein n=1 Tax=Acidisarcina polymorpha TaxID=2211140 RepID=A0A2Z5FWW2_9BACT|nr:hypothetical protein ACPOL_2047 [Acidisarcina polymorpha]